MIFSGAGCNGSPEAPVGSKYSKKFNYPRKELPKHICEEKLWQNLVCRNWFYLHDAKPLLSQQYFFKPMTNERTVDRIVNNTFEEIDAFSKFNNYIWNFYTRKIETAMQNMFFGIFFPKCVNMPHINALWNFFFSKCVDLVPNLTHFEKFFQSA